MNMWCLYFISFLNFHPYPDDNPSGMKQVHVTYRHVINTQLYPLVAY